MGTYGSHDAWPEHPKAWWRDTLGYARERGWSLTTSSGHGWGVMRCQATCKVVVFSTGRGGESVARSARRVIERCQHGCESVTSAVNRHLDAAERHTGAAASLLDRRAQYRAVEEMLELADEALAAIQGELLAEIDELPDEVAEGEIEAALRDADAQVGLVRESLAALPAFAAKAPRKRVEQVRARIAALRAELDRRPANLVRLPTRRGTK